MVLKRIFKSKEQRKKDKLKTDLKKKISNVGGGRSNQGTAKRLQRELKAVDGPKKEVKKTVGGAQANKRKTYGNNQTGGGGSTTNKSSNKKVVKKATMTAKERAQAMAKKRIASGKTIAQVKADNEAKMKARAKKKYADFKAKRNKK